MLKLSSSKTCSRKDNTVKFGINIILHVTFLFTILTALFVFYTSKLLEDSVNGQVIDLLNDNIADKKILVTDKLNKALHTSIDLKYFNFDKIKNVFGMENSERLNNNKLVKTILALLITFFILMFIISVLVAKSLCNDVSVKELLVENIIIFVLVGIIEFTFFTKIILKYIPGYPSTLSKTVIETLKKA